MTKKLIAAAAITLMAVAGNTFAATHTTTAHTGHKHGIVARAASHMKKAEHHMLHHHKKAAHTAVKKA